MFRIFLDKCYVLPIYTVARFILFVITPAWLANGLREGIAAGVYCLIIGVLVIIIEIRGFGGFRNCECNLHSFSYCLGVAFLFFFTVLYLCSWTSQKWSFHLDKSSLLPSSSLCVIKCKFKFPHMLLCKIQPTFSWSVLNIVHTP